MVMPANKDIVIRLTGKDLTAPAFAQAERRAVSFRDRIGKLNAALLQAAGQGIGGRFGTGVSAGLAGGIGGAAVFAAADAMGRVVSAVSQHLQITERLARGFGIITEKMKATAEALSRVQEFEAERGRRLNASAIAPFRATAERLFPEDEPFTLGQPLGNRRQEFLRALRQAQRGREALFRENNPAAREAAERTLIASMTAEFVQSEGREPAGDELARIWKRARAQIKVKFEAAVQTLKAINEGERELRERFGREMLIRNIAGQAQASGAGVLDRIRSIFSGLGSAGSPFAAAFAGFQEFRERNVQARLSTESPAETLQRELGNLDAQLRLRQLSPDLFERQRRRLLMQGIAGLEDQPFTPLSATESRSLTRGQDQNPVNELKRILHQDNQEQQNLLRQILEHEQSRGRLDVVVR